MSSFVYIIYFFISGSRIIETDVMKRNLLKGDIIAYGFICSLQAKGVKKITLLNNLIIDALFIQPEKKRRIQEAFYKAQRVYRGMSLLARVFKIKRALDYDVQTDLCLNPLSELTPSIIHQLFDDDNRTLYNFRMSDLITMITTCLSHSPDFFADPQTLRNPYTNIEFTRAQLYSLYFAVKKSPYVMPLLFHQYFNVDFDILEFCKLNECYIREYAINAFVRNASIEQKYLQLSKMFVDYRKQLVGIIIHDEFPKKTFVAHFSKHLRDYLLECYSLNPTIRHFSKRKLKGELLRFKKLNPNYGRKVITHKIIPKEWTTQNTEGCPVFVFTGTAQPNVKRVIVSSFIDTVITVAPAPRARLPQSVVGQRRRSRRATLDRNRLVRSQEFTSINTTSNVIIDYENGQTQDETQHETQHATQHETQHATQHETQHETQHATQDEMEDEAADYQSDDSLDIDIIIDMMNSDESTIESDDESDYGDLH